ncbi:MAG: hypothetical protein J6M03_05835 [Clostridia bacterium]|nr:hypothetical protein [Clostridia bacterium]
MDNNNQEKIGFTYTYSAKEQAELKRIREKYTAPTEDEDKMARLRRLDASVTNTAQAVALVLGIIGALILGFGMSLIMTDLAEFLGLEETVVMVVGVSVGIVGGILASLAYPIYNAIVKAKRKKLAPEIIRLTDELMK